MTEPPDDLLEPESNPPPTDVEDDQDEDEEPGISGEESLGLLPPD